LLCPSSTGDTEATATHVERLVALATEYGFLGWLGIVEFLPLGQQGDKPTAAALGVVERQLKAAKGSAAWRYVFCVCLLAERFAEAGYVERGHHLLDTITDDDREAFYAPEVRRVEGELLLRSPVPAPAEAARCFVAALELARGRAEKGLELRAATSLARLWQAQGKRAKAHALLAPVSGWFTEGLDTRDLREARALLEELA
jgi:predicted ATPase